MTPKEKADQLIRRFTLDFTMDFDLIIEAALICVYEIIETQKAFSDNMAYWQKVRMCLYEMNNDNHEAKADRFNIDQ